MLVLAPIPAAPAQNALTLVPGQRARLTAPVLGAHHQQFHLVELRADTLIVAADTALACPCSDVVRPEILNGQGSCKWLSAILGLVGGVLTAVGIGYAVGVEGGWGRAKGCVATGGGTVLGLIGAGVRALVGQTITTDIREQVRLARRPVSFVSPPEGWGIVARIASECAETSGAGVLRPHPSHSASGRRCW